VINIVGLDRLIEVVGAMNKASSVKVKGKYCMRRLMGYLNIIKHVYVITFHTV